MIWIIGGTSETGELLEKIHDHVDYIATKDASIACDIKYIRFVRAKTLSVDENIIEVKSIECCKDYLKSINGTVFFTTGSKNIVDFEKVKRDNIYIYRVLPSKFSIDECVENNIELKNIIAILGPFSETLNISLFKEYHVDYVVMKDSGEKGGTKEKLTACQKLGIKVIMIGRETEIGVSDIEKLVEMIL